jgi:hypothetical protein
MLISLIFSYASTQFFHFKQAKMANILFRIRRYRDSLRAGRYGVRIHVGQDFLQPYRGALGHTQPLIQWVPILSRGKANKS